MANRRHGMWNTPTWRSWSAMLTRCQNPNASDYPRYGGRGIKVCARWQVFESFLADMGERPEGKTLDRFPDNNGNYEPGNCRWATVAEQNETRRKTVHRKTRSHQHIQIRWLSDMGWNHGELAHQFGISRTSVRNIIGAHTSKLEEHELEQIRWLFSLGYTGTSIADFFGISLRSARGIRDGRKVRLADGRVA